MKDFASTNRYWIPPEKADADGLAGVGGNLRPETLIRAYADGVFPWYDEADPILWWSPDPRAIIEIDGLHVSRSLARTIRSGKFGFTINRNFMDVIRFCGESRLEGTWITPDMVVAYETLHRLGHAHSLETWVKTTPPTEPGFRQLTDADTDWGEWQLAGGIYGVSVGGFFAGESMFHLVSDGSKLALYALMERLRQRGFQLFDIQMTTDHTVRMGAIEIPRAHYLKRLRQAVALESIQFDG